jgi:hypothetical protein
MSGISQVNTRGGTFHQMSARYDDATRRFDWTIEYSDRVAEGFALTITGGVNPVNNRGTAAMIYVDGARALNGSEPAPRLSAYAYNGRADADSWYDADGDPGNDGASSPVGDCIKTALDSGWILSASAADISLPDGREGRRFSFSINAADLVQHTPMFGSITSPRQNWGGVAFADSLGLYLFSAGVFDVEYAPDGGIASLGTELRGGLSGEGMNTGIPTPGTAVLLGAAAFIGLRRRR